MSPSMAEAIGEVEHTHPEISYRRRIGSGMAVLDVMIRDRSKLITQSELPAHELDRLRRLQREDKACRSVCIRHLENGELFLALETLLLNSVRC